MLKRLGRRYSSKTYWDIKASEKPIEPEEITKAITAAGASSMKTLPLKTRMLTREFIHNSLYHPHYGYFSKNAQVFSPPEPFDFRSMRNLEVFTNTLSQMYDEQERANKNMHLWHTPSELFQPFYGQALANYIIKEYQSSSQQEPLVLYEIGAGNGTLMKDIMDYIKKEEPDLYTKTEYNIIEISKRLSQIQETKKGTHPVKITNCSILDYANVETRPCFFIGMEVLDNLSHDLVRYDRKTKEPLQGVVLIDSTGNFEEVYEPLSDPLLSRYLEMRSQTSYRTPAFTMKMSDLFNPFRPNLSLPEYVPTNAFLLMEKLSSIFPNHRLILSDFDNLRDTVEGIDAPVVQTKYNRRVIPCSTYLVQPGKFDIFFPTNFKLLKLIYAKLTGRNSKIYSHSQFLRKYADVKATRTKFGESPMLNYYENVSFIVS